MEEIILEIICIYPGAFIRWLLFYRNVKTIKEVAKDDPFKNAWIGILSFGLIIGLIFTFLS
jgi:hypothetical protein